MWVWVDRVGWILFDSAFSTTVLLSLVVMAMLVCRQPSIRVQVARAALVASLAMIPLVAFAPLPRLELLNTFLQPDHGSGAGTTRPQSPGGQAPLAGAADRATQQTRPESIAAGADSPLQHWLARGFLLVDIACMAGSLAWLLLGFWGVRWLLGASGSPSRATQDLYDELTSGRLSTHRRAALRVSSRVQRPVLVGIFRPTILIPPSYDEPNPSSELLTLSLLHEIAHAEQSDPLFGTVANLAQAVWFLLPPVWWIRSRLLIDQEFLADRRASLQYGTSSAYAASLLSVAESQLETTRGKRLRAHIEMWRPVQKTVADSPLFQRMLMLLQCPYPVKPRVSRPWSWAIRLTVVAGMIAAACVSIQWPGAGAIDRWRGVNVAAADQPFRVADFIAEPLVFLPDGRALPYTMPVSLPARFELSVEVLSDLTELAKVYIAGHPLASLPLQPLVGDLAGDSPNLAESWHQIRLQRNGETLELWVDGKKVPVQLDPQATTELLSFEPGPRRPAHFRNLIVEW
jgi:beta-lactamase regulating signal transducer with metallopeptidase domain